MSINIPFFKLTCGASYRNLDVIEWLSRLFTIAGAEIIDIGAKPEIVKVAKSGIDSINYSYKIKHKPFLMISIGVNNDVHFFVVKKDEDKCNNCGNCEKYCKHGVFQDYKIYLENCLGCGDCIFKCPNRALSLIPIYNDLYYNNLHLNLEECISMGASAIEIHTGYGNYSEIKKVWDMVSKFSKYWKIVSFSLGSHNLSNQEILKLAKYLVSLTNSKVILQIDGNPISGKSGKESTIKSLKLAQFILKEKIPAFIQVSGGTNNLTGKIAKDMGLKIDGIAMGSFARSYLGIQVSNLLQLDWDKCIIKAKELVNSVRMIY